MAVILHLVCFVEWSPWVVHHHDECTVDRSAHRLVEELHGCIFPWLANGFSVLVLEYVCELADRLA